MALYEDKALGKITEQRYVSMMAKFDEEQLTLAVKAENIQKELDTVRQQSMNASLFAETVRKYIDLIISK
ncbi:hypothetical protein C4577_06275 [Candidatus Parcubacteria bacterium]|nr:MAG: hypothetical protein C4577_06275 [Candidatus Parcubacteria bacterium]